MKSERTPQAALLQTLGNGGFTGHRCCGRRRRCGIYSILGRLLKVLLRRRRDCKQTVEAISKLGVENR